MTKNFLCTEDLYMQNGALAFKKGKIYKGTKIPLTRNTFYNFHSERGPNHAINSEGQWGRAFKEVTKKTLTFVKNET